MEDLSLHILDVAENAVRADADVIEITVHEDPERRILELRIKDNGRGMDAETLERALDPFFTTRSGSRVGLGLPLLRQAAEEADGDLRVWSGPGRGTEVVATFDRGHPDARPLGDVCGTLAALVVGHPRVRFIFNCETEDMQAHFDSLPDGTEQDGAARPAG